MADTFAWVLMRNHFHVLVRIKEEEEIGFIPVRTASNNLTRSGYKTDELEFISDERVGTFVAPSEVINPGGMIPKNTTHRTNFRICSMRMRRQSTNGIIEQEAYLTILSNEN